MYNFRATSASDFFSKYDSTINRFKAFGNNIREDSETGKILLAYTASPNVTALCHFAAYGSIGENTILDHLWFMPIHQYTTLGSLILDGEQYFTSGYWVTDFE